VINIRTSSGSTQAPTPTPASIPPPPDRVAVCAIKEVPNHFFVESEDKRMAYRVFWDGTRGQCTCADYSRRGNGHHCVHINAVIARPKEDDAGTDDDEMTEILIGAFNHDQVSEYDGIRSVKYLEVVKRLNEAFGELNWSFAHDNPDDTGDSFVCRGKLEIEITGRKLVKGGVGLCKYTDARQSESYDDDLDAVECGFAVDMGNAQVGAVHAALKNCAMMLGVGIEECTPPPSTPATNTHRPPAVDAYSPPYAPAPSYSPPGNNGRPF